MQLQQMQQQHQQQQAAAAALQQQSLAAAMAMAHSRRQQNFMSPGMSLVLLRLHPVEFVCVTERSLGSFL